MGNLMMMMGTCRGVIFLLSDFIKKPLPLLEAALSYIMRNGLYSFSFFDFECIDLVIHF